MQSFASIAVLSSAAAAIGSNELEFTKYAARFNKIYEDVEDFAKRFERFMHHDRLISEHNDTYKNFSLGHNQFTDWTDAEYKAIQGYVRDATEENEKS